MTCASTSPGTWLLTFLEPEALFLTHVLGGLSRHYEMHLADLPARQRAFWQGTISRENKKSPDLKESQEMLSDARLELRSERHALAQNWLRDFELTEKRDPWQIEITTAQRDELVAMLNDRRILLALEAGITDGEMEAQPEQIPNELRRATIMEIDVLGHFIILLLGPQIHRP